MAASITLSDFKEALGRYPIVLKEQHSKAKPDAVPIADLDKFRFVDAPTRFSKKTGNSMGLEDVKKLIDWKLRHGTFRPKLQQLVASNSEDDVEAALNDAFNHYADDSSDIKGVIERLTKPLKGIGPAAASLLLAVHDPDHVVFFSDEAYRWIVADGKPVSLKYKFDEFDELFARAKDLQTRLKVSPIEIEKAAYVLIKENEPAKKEKIPGRGRGRPPIPDELKKTKKEKVPGRGRGRPPKDGIAPQPKKPVTTPGKRGRKPKAKPETEEKAEQNEEASGVEEEEAATPAPASAKGKRKAKDDDTAKGSAKKVKA